MFKSIAAALVVASGMLVTGAAHAGSHVSWSIGISTPVIGSVVTNAPYYPSAPVYVPAPVYAPVPVYGVVPAPVYYPRSAYYRPVPVVYPYRRWAYADRHDDRRWDRHDGGQWNGHDGRQWGGNDGRGGH